MSVGESVGESGDLDGTGVVTEVEKGEAAVDTVEGDPPAESDAFADVGGG